MSKFIPPTKRSHQPKWVYLANPKTGEVVRESRISYMEIYHRQDKGFRRTSRSVYDRITKGKGTKATFTPSEYPTRSGKYIYSNVTI